MNYKNILFYLGFILLVVSFFSILNILYAIYFNFIIDLYSYLMTFFTSLLMSLAFFYYGKNESKNITLNEQIIFIFLGFTLMPLFISIPYFFSIYDLTFLDSYFESVSGITTTGFSIMKNINIIDEPLLLWRSSSQWLGGLLFLIAIIGTIGSKQAKIKPSYLISGGASGKNFYKNFNFNFIKIILIYFISTLLIIFLFYFAKVRLFDSVNLAFTAISSGGFVPAKNLYNILENNLQVFLMSLALLLPIFNFFIFFDITFKKFEIKNNQEDLHLLFLIVFIT